MSHSLLGSVVFSDYFYHSLNTDERRIKLHEIYLLPRPNVVTMNKTTKFLLKYLMKRFANWNSNR